MAVKRYAIVGTGIRSTFYYKSITQDFKDVAKLVALCDTNQTRMSATNDRIVEYGGERLPTYKADDFDKMVHEQKPDCVIVTTVDKVHHVYCVRALELGCDAITEKPLTVDEEKLQLMIDAVKATGRQIRVLFNYRYAPHHSKVREVIASGVIGEVTSVHMDWALSTAHGSDFMHRWHRSKENSGGLQTHKSTHHFDLVHFWLNTEPVLVYCIGGLRFYGRENAEKRGIRYTGERSLNNPSAKDDPFAVHLDDDAQLKKLYLDAEHEDGYVRDRNCFGEGITIEDTLSMIIKYKNDAVMTYNSYAYAPWEGYRCVFTGTKGRFEVTVVEKPYSTGGEDVTGIGLEGFKNSHAQESVKLVVQPLFEEPYTIDVQPVEGGHGGGDPLLLDDVLIGTQADTLNRAAFLRDGANSVLVGVGANHSMKTGLPVKVQELVRW